MREGGDGRGRGGGGGRAQVVLADGAVCGRCEGGVAVRGERDVQEGF